MKLKSDPLVALAFLLTWLLAVHEVNTHNPSGDCKEIKKIERIKD